MRLTFGQRAIAQLEPQEADFIPHPQLSKAI